MKISGVLVVGGGYAGLHAARSVASADVAVTVLNPTDVHDHVTRLSGVAGGTTPSDRATTPLAAFGHDVVIGTATSIGDGTVELADGRTIDADAVVVTAGARPTKPPIDGLDNAWTIRTGADARGLRQAIASAARVIVVGGGATGVQLAGSAAAAHPGLDVVIVDSSSRLLTPMSDATGAGARRILEQRGVDIRFDTEVEKISADGVLLDGESVDGVVVWAGGFESRADSLGVDVSREGRALVDDHLRLVGMERTFAAGDVAAHLMADGEFAPLSAQIAVQAGVAAGENAAKSLLGERLSTPTLVQRGWVLDLGGRRGLAEFGPVTLTGPFVDLVPPLLHDAIDVKTVVGERGFSALPCAAWNTLTS